MTAVAIPDTVIDRAGGLDGSRSEAIFSRDRVYRYTLKRVWPGGTGRVCFVMLNPSTANALKDDPTVARCGRFARAWGYSSLMVVNIYPFRSPDPELCRLWLDNRTLEESDALEYNGEVILDQAASSDLVVCAWGAARWAAPWAKDVSAAIRDSRTDELQCLGLTSGGAPTHPLARGARRVPDSQRPIPYREAVPA